ncbi:hypothetical protein [Coleofasciculus sp. E2-BRE-01]|uniref:hypothetical protein n=1 Tax=Coleofasciculus sp. E2-BRE-01 TaxID=3069524 RepID=UPI0032F2E0C5
MRVLLGVGFRVSGVGFRVSGVGCRVSGVGCREKLTLRLREGVNTSTPLGVELYSGSNQKLYCLFVGSPGERLRLTLSPHYGLLCCSKIFPTPHTPHPIPCLPLTRVCHPFSTPPVGAWLPSPYGLGDRTR